MHQNILKASLFTPLNGGRWGLPMLCWGPPGAAKTAFIEEVCARYNLPCETLSPSERGEGAFGVVPVPQTVKVGKESTTLLTYPAPEWVHRFLETGRGVVFVDEATSTPPALQAPLMGLIHAHRIGGITLPLGVRVLGAANPPQVAAGGYDLAPPLANRFGHLDWEVPTIDQHAQFMMRGSSGHGGVSKLLQTDDGEEPTELAYDAVAEEKRVLAAWPIAYAKAVGLETAFLQRRRGLKNVFPKSNDPKVSRAWPSDRSWEAATRAYASAEVHGLDSTESETFVEAFIGNGAASEWFGWMTSQDLPDPARLLDGKITFKHEAARVDRTFAVLQACAALVCPRQAQRRTERANVLWELLQELAGSKADTDIIVPTATAMIEADLHGSKQSIKVLAVVNPILRAAGYTGRP